MINDMWYYRGDSSPLRRRYLLHSGTKGMRWGTRHYRNYDGTLTPEGKERYNYRKTKFGSFNDYINREKDSIKRKLKTTHLETMTDEELIRFTQRLNLETSYRDAVNRNKEARRKQRSRASQLVEGILEKGVSTVADMGFRRIGRELFEDDIKKKKKNKDKNKNKNKGDNPKQDTNGPSENPSKNNSKRSNRQGLKESYNNGQHDYDDYSDWVQGETKNSPDNWSSKNDWRNNDIGNDDYTTDYSYTDRSYDSGNNKYDNDYTYTNNYNSSSYDTKYGSRKRRRR